ncbi:extracellular solute-binding protein [Streptomonospora salina]|uniref:Cellobiose transport system substrate-binding protein n=1 Tax=Streptomonospora salina TaxID=104205 RepID=A0A841EBL6_9ACTN|nr:extracellular solute-binding protein [Streptomonospora salina]MBB6000535.1 cellobiose transport system substrate-binding protein [Streptomonospora salina]
MATAMLGSGALLLATACGGGGDSADGGEINLVLDTFGTPGYNARIQAFEEEHPDVTIEERNVADVADYTPQLQQNLAAGSGAGDVVMVEEANVAQFYAQSDQFVDLNDHNGAELEDNFLPWKWDQGHNSDGALLGLGTDIGSMSMCYNMPLFEDAGLPTDPEELGESWETWDDFIASGEEFMDAETGASFVSTVQPYFRAVLAQKGGEPYQNRDGELIIEQQQSTRDAYDTVTEMADVGLSGSLQIWSEEWNAGIQNNAFATLPCPAWMLGTLEDTAGDEGTNQWNVASVPGEGGNWGGSFLSVPSQTENQDMAIELAKFLTSKEGQLSAWEEANLLPSNPEALKDPKVTEFTRGYFNDAPVGEIFSATALELEPIYFGPDTQAIDDGFRSAVESVEQGQASPEEGWEAALQEAERATGEG